MTIDVSSSLTSALAYLERGPSAFLLTTGEKNPPKQSKGETFPPTLPKQEYVKS